MFYYDIKTDRNEINLNKRLKEYLNPILNKEISYDTINDLLYDYNVLDEFVDESLLVSCNGYINLLDRYLIRLSKHYYNYAQLHFLFDDLLNKHYNKRYFNFDEVDVNLFKEIITVLVYLNNRDIKQRVVTKEDGMMFLTKLLDCDENYIYHLNDKLEDIKRKIVINICSYKNSNYLLMQYPECVSLTDLKELTYKNINNNKTLINVVNEYTSNKPHYKGREAVMRFLVETVRNNLC